MNKKILVIAAHADDEVLGCGGTIARHSDMGDEVHIVILADGVSSRKSKHFEKDLDLRLQSRDEVPSTTPADQEEHQKKGCSSRRVY